MLGLNFFRSFEIVKISGMALGTLLVASFATAQTATPTKVGIINIQAAIIGTKDGQAAAQALEQKSAPKKRELEKLQAEINGSRDRLNKMSSVGSEDEKRKLMAEIDQRTKSFNRQVEDAQAELDQEQGRVLNELGGRMLTVLDKYAKDNGFAVVLDVSAQNTPVLFAANQVDLTKQLIELYDKNAPAAPGTSSAAPSSAAPSAVAPSALTAPAGTVAPGASAAPRPATRPATTAPKPGAAK
jgi:outer membrane protein